MSWGTGSEHPTKAQRLGYPGRVAEALYVLERRCLLVSLGLRVWGGRSWVPTGVQNRSELLGLRKAVGRSSPTFTEGGCRVPAGLQRRGGRPAGNQEKGVGVSPAIRGREVRESLPGSQTGDCWLRDIMGSGEGGWGRPRGSGGGPGVPIRVRRRGCGPPQRLRKQGRNAPPGFKGPRGPGRDSASLRDHSAPPPPGSQGRRGQDSSRLSSRPAAPLRPPAPGSRAGPRLALLPPRRAGPSSAPPPSRPVLHATACSARTRRCARSGLGPSHPPPRPPGLFQARPVNNTRTCRPAPVAIGTPGILRGRGGRREAVPEGGPRGGVLTRLEPGGTLTPLRGKRLSRGSHLQGGRRGSGPGWES